jgi:thiol-disulfide isomerase/thioredoxin
MRASWYVYLCVGLSMLVCLQITSLPLLAVEKGDIAPDFTFPSLLESNFVTLSDYKGKVVFLDFWSAWCAPCRDSLPRLAKMRNSFSSEQFELVSIDVDVEPKDAVKFLEDVTSGAPINYPLAMDPGAVSARLYRYTTIPASYLIDQNGVIEQVHANFQAKDVGSLKQEISRLINRQYDG